MESHQPFLLLHWTLLEDYLIESRGILIQTLSLETGTLFRLDKCNWNCIICISCSQIWIHLNKERIHSLVLRPFQADNICRKIWRTSQSSHRNIGLNDNTHIQSLIQGSNLSDTGNKLLEGTHQHFYTSLQGSSLSFEIVSCSQMLLQSLQDIWNSWDNEVWIHVSMTTSNVHDPLCIYPLSNEHVHPKCELKDAKDHWKILNQQGLPHHRVATCLLRFRVNHDQVLFMEGYLPQLVE